MARRPCYTGTRNLVQNMEQHRQLELQPLWTPREREQKWRVVLSGMLLLEDQQQALQVQGL